MMVKSIHASRMPKMKPAHPGEILREDVLPALKISVVEAARKLGVSRQSLHGVMAGRSAVSADMALRLGKLVGNDARWWLSLQQAFDLHEAETRLRGEIEAIPTLVSA
jgi:addiction module HigA family antidote